MLDLHQRQIVDLQERVSVLERTPVGERPAGGGLDLVPLIVKAVGAVARAAADAGGDSAGERPVRRSLADTLQAAQAVTEKAPRRGALAEWLAQQQAAAVPVPAPSGLSGEHEHVHRRLTPGEAATVPPLFPIAEPEPAAPYAGRTAPRRTLPPETPVRLWNRDHTDHLDVIGRAVRGVENTQVRIRNNQTDIVRAWLAPLVESDECGPVYVAWMDREWSLAGYSFSDNSTGVLDLLPLPKPPRVDQVLGRAPYAGPWPHLAKGDRIGVEHPDGTITTHEFSGDPANPVADEPNPALSRRIEAMRQAAQSVLNDAPEPEAYTIPDHLGTVPEYGEPVGTVTSGLIRTEPFHPDGDRAARGDGWPTPTEFNDKYFRRTPVPPADGSLPNPLPPSPEMELTNDYAEPDVDEVLPMPGGPNDKLAQANRPAIRFHTADGGESASTTNITEHELDHLTGGRYVYVRFDSPNAQLFLRHRELAGQTIRADWAGRTWTVISGTPHSTGDTSITLGPLPGEPGAPDAPKLDPLADLMTRADEIHDAVADEDDQ
ncbi:hypothetical protein [Tsukamurella pulmonis]|uniref:hypothetical protein n=1 Tax=Tsukamurella pulmonis TaxID=47312 RepID=UPI001EDCA553|nr:hypothetical protein [Tsukamurella pulmonis]